MKNAMQLKSAIKQLAKDKHLSAQLVMQNYMLERLLERISLSPYCDNFILKGGLLIASIVGLHSRATMDMDSTIRNYPVNEKTVREMFEVIADMDLEDGIAFALQRIGKIREKDEYDGYRVSLTANFAPMQIPLKLDVTTGDKITPAAVEYRYPLMFEDRELSIFAYNLETILAEKLETVISRGDQNTRPRDYYDIFIRRRQRLQEHRFLRGRRLQRHEFRPPRLAALDCAGGRRAGRDCHRQGHEPPWEGLPQSRLLHRGFLSGRGHPVHRRQQRR